ncbi:MAG: 4Fe-4S dicluster domain-containing protein [Deltaproteobacteria bacterium]|nr:4Fe-4S dicluster domain-containing protein [Deltaproteobacteria bacterium]
MSRRETADASGGDGSRGPDAVDVPESVFLCIQCRKCTAGCPVAEGTDVPVNELVARVRLGDIDGAVRSRMIWDCLGCHACSTRCPTGAEPAEVLDWLRARATELGLAPSSRAGTFHSAFLKTLRKKGRSDEARLMVRIYLKHWLTWKELRRGMAMRGKGRVRALGRSIRARRDLQRIFDLAQGSLDR